MDTPLSVLVTGGCGYIGSHVVRLLSAAGYLVTIVDDLSTGLSANVQGGERLVVGDFGDPTVLHEVLGSTHFSAALHFAASISVEESSRLPLSYYQNNAWRMASFLEISKIHGLKRIIFSSSAAVYGEGQALKLTEATPPRPINPYGRTKLIGEWLLEDLARSVSLDYVALRYFNVAGATSTVRLGPRKTPATHLIQVACDVAMGVRRQLTIHGTDYPTPDGTAIRDYVHVEDIASAHLAALDYLLAGGTSCVLNCGYGRGHSVKEVVATIEALTGRRLPIIFGPRRAGDPAVIVADNSAILAATKWRPKFASLDAIVNSVLALDERQKRTAS